MTGTAILPDRGATLRSRNGLVRRCGDALHERGDELLEVRLLDKRSRLARLDPLDRPLLELRPGLALPLDQQWEDPDLAGRLHARLVERLLVGEKTQRFGADLAS